MRDLVLVAIASSAFTAVLAVGVGLLFRLGNYVEDLQIRNRELAQRLSLLETDLIDAKRSQTISQAAVDSQSGTE